MSKRPQVPTALHDELTEYSSLLRALRTAKTLDLAAHLVQPAPASATTVFVPDDDEAPNDPPLTRSVSSGGVASEVGSSVRSQISGQFHEQLSRKGKARQRDTWSRWPLVAGDVYVPEWGLADEVQHIAENVLKFSQGQGYGLRYESEHGDADAATLPTPADGSTLEEDNALTLSPAVSHALTADSAAFLTRILALLAAHVPSAEKSMQNRIRPIDWETVVDIACANGAISTRTALLVRERMTRIYPSQRNLVPRVEHLITIKAQLAGTLSKHDDSLFAMTPSVAEVKRRRGPYKKRRVKTVASPSTERPDDDGS